MQVPTLVLAGDRDPGFTAMRATADRIPGAPALRRCRAAVTWAPSPEATSSYR